MDCLDRDAKAIRKLTVGCPRIAREEHAELAIRFVHASREANEVREFTLCRFAIGPRRRQGEAWRPEDVQAHRPDRSHVDSNLRVRSRGNSSLYQTNGETTLVPHPDSPSEKRVASGRGSMLTSIPPQRAAGLVSDDSRCQWPPIFLTLGEGCECSEVMPKRTRHTDGDRGCLNYVLLPVPRRVAQTTITSPSKKNKAAKANTQLPREPPR